MNLKQLQNIATILRRDSLKMTTAAKSGHPTSCLSCAEIISTLFFSEMKYDTKNPDNPDNDEFILSKGHATPILYSALFHSGCIKNDLNKLRKLNSPLEGHPIPRSLKWIKAATGSLGQGLGVGVGMALAAKLQKRKFKTFVLLGDSESAEGSIYEALEIAAKYNLNNLIAIIDINRLGQRGETMLGYNIEKYQQRFKSFDCNVFSVDGHNIKEILQALKKARNSIKPVIILAKTFKGKGVPLIENKNGWHGKPLNKEDLTIALRHLPNPTMPKIKITKPKQITHKFLKQKYKSRAHQSHVRRGPIFETPTATRKAYGMTLAALAKANSNILAIDGEVSNSTYSGLVKKETPKQFIESFIAEQNMVSMSLGLSIKKFNTFTSTFAAFFSRAHDQIRMAAISSANMTFSGSHAGVSIGEDGASQMGIEDIAIFRALPNSFVFYPSDAISTTKLTVLASKIKGIKYIRTTRESTPILYKSTEKFPIGDFKILKQSKQDKAILIGAGITTHEALEAHKKLKQKNIDVAILDIYCIKPFNYNKLIKFAKSHGNKIIIAEDHRPEGGIGEMITKGLINSNIKIKHLSIKEIPHSGKIKELLGKYKINSTAYISSFKSKW